MKIFMPPYTPTQTEVCDWLGDNTPVTRFYSIGMLEIAQSKAEDNTFPFTFDAGNKWADKGDTANTKIAVHLPHGATVTAFRVTSQEVGGAAMTTYLWRRNHATGVTEELGRASGTATMEEISDTTIANEVIDNDTYAYYVFIEVGSAGTEQRFRAIQIDYTIVRPYT